MTGMSRTAEPSWTGTISTAAAPDSTAARNFTEALNSTAGQTVTEALNSTAGQTVTAALDSTPGRTVTAALDSTAAALRLLPRFMDQRPPIPRRALLSAPSAGSIIGAWREGFCRAGRRGLEGGF